VVISWVTGDQAGSMVWLRRDPITGEYGARRFETEDGSFEEVVRPFGDFANVKPTWIHDHGTLVICLGNNGTEDTYLGKDGQGDIKGLSAYLNKRVWTLPNNVNVYVQELRSQKREDWPRSRAEAAAPTRAEAGLPTGAGTAAEILGARHFLTAPAEKGTLAAQGVLTL